MKEGMEKDGKGNGEGNGEGNGGNAEGIRQVAKSLLSQGISLESISKPQACHKRNQKVIVQHCCQSDNFCK